MLWQTRLLMLLPIFYVHLGTGQNRHRHTCVRGRGYGEPASQERNTHLKAKTLNEDVLGGEHTVEGKEEKHVAP